MVSRRISRQIRSFNGEISVKLEHDINRLHSSDIPFRNFRLLQSLIREANWDGEHRTKIVILRLQMVKLETVSSVEDDFFRIKFVVPHKFASLAMLKIETWKWRLGCVWCSSHSCLMSTEHGPHNWNKECQYTYTFRFFVFYINIHLLGIHIKPICV